MKFEEIENILDQSKPDEWLYDDQFGVYTYKADVSLNLIMWEREKYPEELFKENWATQFPDPKAVKCIIKVMYNGSFVKAYLFVHVDGYRNILPAPRSPRELTITHFQYNLGKILNNLEPMLKKYDEYLKTAGIKIEPEQEYNSFVKKIKQVGKND